MISDVLFEAIEQLDCYLDEEQYDETYGREIRKEALEVRNAMEALRKKLDASPVDTMGEIEFKV